MGIDAIALSSAIKKHWLYGTSVKKNRKILEKAARNWAASRQLGPLLQLRSISLSSVEIEIIPTADPIRIEFVDDGLTASFRSSNAGPGFHAAAIDLLESVAQALSVSWCWTANGQYLDETKYANTRSFSKLQFEMATFLRRLCDSVLTSGNDIENHSTDFSLCLPHGLGLFHGKVACPLGFAPKNWIHDISRMDEVQLLDAAEGFFVWWEEGLTLATWARILLAQLWQNAQWRPAVTDSDRLVLAQIRHSYAQATAGGTKLPDDLEQAYSQYLRCQFEENPPSEEGIGYRKYLVWIQPYASWAMALPGYMVANGDGDSCFEHPALWIGMTSLEYTLKPGMTEPLESSEGSKVEMTKIRDGLFFKKDPRKTEDGTSTQSATIYSKRPNGQKILVITLSSEFDWPFNEFDRWIRTIYCPDLTNPTSSTLN